MSIENVVLWYEKNVNYKLTKTFLKFLIKTGIIKEEINLELLNSFLLETFGNDFVKENDKFKIKNNRIQIIDNFKDEVKTNDKDNSVKLVKEVNNIKNKFKIESVGGKRLKLVKV